MGVFSWLMPARYSAASLPAVDSSQYQSPVDVPYPHAVFELVQGGRLYTARNFGSIDIDWEKETLTAKVGGVFS